MNSNDGDFFREAFDPAANHLRDEWLRDRGESTLISPTSDQEFVWDTYYYSTSRRAYWEAIKMAGIVITMLTLIRWIAGK